MAIERTFQNLVDECRKLRESLKGLRQFVIEDKPSAPENRSVEELGNAVEEAVAGIEEVLKAAIEARRAVGHPVQLDLARRELVCCQEAYNRLFRNFVTDLTSYDPIAALKIVVREQGGEWRSWVKGVRDVLGRCRAPMDDLTQALFLCWQELAERAGGMSVSVQATSIGKQRVAKMKK